MTGRFPIEMPSTRISGSVFELDRVDFAAPEQGGAVGGVTAGWPRWRMEISLTNMRFDLADIWRAFVTRLRGQQRRFIGFEPGRRYPRRYPDGFRRMVKVDGTAFTGPAASWAQAIETDGTALLTLTGLPSGFRLELGDYVGFRWDADGSDVGANDRRSLVRVTAGDIADAVGAITVEVEPPVPALTPVDAVAHLDRPGCIMVLIVDGTNLGPQGIRHVAAGGQVVAVQDLRP